MRSLEWGPTTITKMITVQNLAFKITSIPQLCPETCHFSGRN